jgi:hypothetical protein
MDGRGSFARRTAETERRATTIKTVPTVPKIADPRFKIVARMGFLLVVWVQTF